MSVPTTLSAGEFAPYAGCTDPGSKVKETYVSRLHWATGQRVVEFRCWMNWFQQIKGIRNLCSSMVSEKMNLQLMINEYY